jgi:hypothetical protein
MRQVLFLCSGNYYCSRFAEQLFNWLAGYFTVPLPLAAMTPTGHLGQNYTVTALGDADMLAWIATDRRRRELT